MWTSLRTGTQGQGPNLSGEPTLLWVFLQESYQVLTVKTREIILTLSSMERGCITNLKPLENSGLINKICSQKKPISPEVKWLGFYPSLTNLGKREYPQEAHPSLVERPCGGPSRPWLITPSEFLASINLPAYEWGFLELDLSAAPAVAA